MRGRWWASSWCRRAGIEGSAVYAVSRDLLAGGGLLVDLVPDLDVAEVARRLARPRGKASMANHLRKALGLTGVKAALLREAGPLPGDADALAARIKAVPVAVRGPRPLDEAISVAGGVAAGALDGELMLRAGQGCSVRARCWTGMRRRGGI